MAKTAPAAKTKTRRSASKIKKDSVVIFTPGLTERFNNDWDKANAIQILKTISKRYQKANHRLFIFIDETDSEMFDKLEDFERTSKNIIKGKVCYLLRRETPKIKDERSAFTLTVDPMKWPLPEKTKSSDKDVASDATLNMFVNEFVKRI